MHEDKSETDCESGEVSGSDLGVGSAQDYEHENECSDCFDKEGSAETSGIGHAVGAETCRITHGTRSSCSLDDYVQNCRSGNTAYDLADPVSAGFFPAHSAGKGETECNRRVDMATGDSADGVSHSDN